MPSTERPKLRNAPQAIKLEQQKLHLSVFGEIGVGKTTLAGSFPKPLIIDTDGGLVSLAYAADPGADLGMRWSPDGYEDLEALYYHVRDAVRTNGYESLILDDVGTLCDLLMTELTEEHAKAEPHKKRPALMAHIPEQIEYLGTRNQIRTFLKRVSQLNLHICCVSGVREVGKPVADKRDLDAAPSVAKVVGKWADTQGELLDGVTDDSWDGEKRILYCQPGGNRIVKSRFADHRPFVADPTFEKLWSPVYAKFEAAAAAQAAAAE